MRRSLFAAKGLRGAGFAPAKPVLSWYATGQFKINNFNASFAYDMNVTSGTIIRSGDILTLSALTATATITPSFGPSGPSATAARKPYAYTPDTRYTYDCSYTTGGECTHFSPALGAPNCGPGSGCAQGCENGNYCCDSRNPTVYHQQTCTGGSAPQLITESGYVGSGTEWYVTT